jgi:hypothetical protein
MAARPREANQIEGLASRNDNIARDGERLIIGLLMDAKLSLTYKL